VITLYDADRCPYCARVRIVLAEKSVPHDTVVIDLSDRPAWLYEKNPLGKVPVLEEDGLCIPESAVIMELLEERFPEPPLFPADPAQRALARLAVWRFDDEFSRDYYAARRDDDGASRERFTSRLVNLDRRLTESPFLAGHEYSLADIAWFPWLPRAEAYLDLRLEDYPAITAWRDRLAERPAVAAEIDVVTALTA
jgi:glutathione S-transferase